MEMKIRFSTLLLALLILFNCGTHQTPIKLEPPVDNTRQITILYTNDEHGWMEPTDKTGGAAGLMGRWRDKDGYAPNKPYLIVSGGDMWTGPAISTWFQGESMVEVMNAMNYSAAAIGNHEFDFKIEGLKKRLQESSFPYLSANIREKSSGKIPEFSKPYIIKEVNDIKIGLIGLTSLTTPTSTFPDNVIDYTFLPYEPVLEEYVPKVKAEGAELIMVLGHICEYELENLVPTAQRLGISIITGGHCNDKVAQVTDGITLIEGGGHLQGYVKVDLSFDIQKDRPVSVTANYFDNIGGAPDSTISAIVKKWKTRTDEQLSEVIGYVNKSIPRYSSAMHHLVTDSWLVGFPTAHISATNRGGIRADIPAGDISLGTIVGVLPFENSIVELELTGAELIKFVASSRPVVGGMTTSGGYQLTNGKPIDSNTIYKVLTTDYLYSVTPELAVFDPTPYHTAVNYRQPVIDWIRSLQTTAANPLDKHLAKKVTIIDRAINRYSR
ncbi:bifunctional metallophosphatase/5'-nucleotidase [candidate division KSB1 bacterium]|nr:bifunctional metallophosphatase/5'-nucleotidase [candidate division KSB1 bacterium]